MEEVPLCEVPGWRRSPALVLSVLLVLHVLAQADRNLLVAFSPQITSDLGIGNARYGLLTGAVWVVSFGAMAILMGALADRHARPRVIAGGLAIWSVCTTLSGYAETYPQMVLARLLVASGEAALVPASVSLLVELYPLRQRAGAIGIFFTGIPLGIGASFLLAGTAGRVLDWRDLFHLLGLAGLILAFPLAFCSERRDAAAAPRGARPLQQIRAVAETLAGNPALVRVIAGFVLVHFVFVGFSFLQLWLVRERGMEASLSATRIGALQLVFGLAGSVGGGLLADRLAMRLRGGIPAVISLLIAIGLPLMLLCRLSTPLSPLFYAGLCASFFLPMAVYGPANALVQSFTPPEMRSTVTGFAMLAINLFAISLGNFMAGTVIDEMLAAGFSHPYTAALLATDAVAGLALPLFLSLRIRKAA